ncbi:MAG: phosphoadenylyl-sulfate reductase [Deltaproteobacteria bacterium]|nr:phosphoadenylyl-sulfate reductase [Deltaproteobacteria bacterium]
MPAALTIPEVPILDDQLSRLDAEAIVRWSVNRFGRQLAFACSFGAEDVVVLDLLLQADAGARVFVLDTGRLPQETHDLIHRAGEHYGRGFEFFFPDAQALAELVRSQGTNGFHASIDNRRACCRVRKVEPLARALAGAGAWLTGLRRAQSVTRHGLQVVEHDQDHGGIPKLNPLAGWSEDRVWNYIRGRGLPHSTLHGRGYPSIGCAPCTRAIEPGEEARAGRWWWEAAEHKECGLHFDGGKLVARRAAR